MISVLITLMFSWGAARHAFGGDFVEDSQSSGSDSSDSTFDPFSDYSEFEEGSEEESDVNFFHNGRFFSVSLVGGYESFTDTYGQFYQSSVGYGIFVSYFFDLRFALQVGYMTADHNINLVDGRTSNVPIQGKGTFGRFEFDTKYYLNTQNVTKGLAWINPYLLIGFSNYTRTITLTTSQGFVRDTAFGFQGGGGVEFPLMKGRMFFGAQALYNYVSFSDRGSPINIGGTNSNIIFNGDLLTFLALLGFNF